MSNEAQGYVDRYSPYRGAVFAVHRAIADTVNDVNDNRFWMSLTKLSKKARVDRKTAGTAVQRLTDDGFLRCEKPPIINEGPTGRPGCYQFLFPRVAVVFDSRGDALDLAPDEFDEPDLEHSEGGEASFLTPLGEVPDGEFHGCLSAGPRAADTVAHPGQPGGEASLLTPGSRGEEWDLTGEASLLTGVGRDSSRGEASRPMNPREPNTTQTESNVAIAVPATAPDGQAQLVEVLPAAATVDRPARRRAHIEIDPTTGARIDRLWEAALAAFGYDAPDEIADRERKRLNTAVEEIRRAGGAPDQIAGRLAAFRALFPGATPTLMAIATRWAECDPARAHAVVTAPTLDSNNVALAQALARRETSPR